MAGAAGDAVEAGLLLLRHGCAAPRLRSALAQHGAGAEADGGDHAAEPLVRPLHWWLAVTCVWMVCCTLV